MQSAKSIFTGGPILLRILTYSTHLFGGTDAAFFGQGHKVGGAWIVKDAVGQPMIYAEDLRRI